MRPAASTAAARDAAGIQEAIERFLKASRQPFLLEPGEEPIPLVQGQYTLKTRGSRLLLEAWDDNRNVLRRVTGVAEVRHGRMKLVVECFARRTGQLLLIDLSRPGSREAGQRGERTIFLERFRLFLSREYPAWKLAEVSAGTDLEHSLSPAFPRAFLSRGQSGIAAMAAPPGGPVDGLLSFALIWLDHLRRRARRIVVERLLLFLPAGAEMQTCRRVQFLDQAKVRAQIFAYSAADYLSPVDPHDFGNLDTKLEVVHSPPKEIWPWVELLSSLPGVQVVTKPNGGVSLSVRGIEFAATAGRELLFGLEKRAAVRDYNIAEVKHLAAGIEAIRSPRARDAASPLYRKDPERW
ncbi:MAG: hypothetical protein ABIZ80_06005, partial [Bryobacteraceae bacterium]